MILNNDNNAKHEANLTRREQLSLATRPARLENRVHSAPRQATSILSPWTNGPGSSPATTAGTSLQEVCTMALSRGLIVSPCWFRKQPTCHVDEEPVVKQRPSLLSWNVVSISGSCVGLRWNYPAARQDDRVLAARRKSQATRSSRSSRWLLDVVVAVDVGVVGGLEDLAGVYDGTRNKKQQCWTGDGRCCSRGTDQGSGWRDIFFEEVPLSATRSEVGDRGCHTRTRPP